MYICQGVNCSSSKSYADPALQAMKKEGGKNPSMQLKGRGMNIAIDKKNWQICSVNKKNVRGTSITIYYTYMSPVYAFM